MIFFRSLIFCIFMISWSSFIFFALSPIFFINKRFGSFITGKCWAILVLLALRVICGLRYRVEQLDEIPKNPILIVSNHQSMWETVFLLYYFEYSVFIYKQELRKIPVYGWFLDLSGMIAIDRSNGIGSIKKILKRVKSVYANKSNIIIFPEGTRVNYGENKPFLPGVYVIHKSNPEIPVVTVSHNSGKFWGRSPLKIKPGVITVKISNFEYKNDFINEIQNVIQNQASSI